MKYILLTFITLILFTSCATMFTGNTQNVQFVSDPEGALVKIDGIPRGYTPLTLALEKDQSYRVTFSMDGYYDSYETLTPKVNGGWVFLDAITSVIGVVIDYATGSWNKLIPKDIAVDMVPLT